MGEVVNIDDHRSGWITGYARCHSCGNEWVAVSPDNITILECFYCHKMTGMYTDRPVLAKCHQ